MPIFSAVDLPSNSDLFGHDRPCPALSSIPPVPNSEKTISSLTFKVNSQNYLHSFLSFHCPRLGPRLLLALDSIASDGQGKCAHD